MSEDEKAEDICPEWQEKGQNFFAKFCIFYLNNLTLMTHKG